MNRLMERKPILHAVIWIMMYIAMVNVGDALSEQIGIIHIATSIILILFSVVLMLYMKKNNWTQKYGIRGITKKDMSKTLLYAPLIVLAFIQFFTGINPTLSMAEMAILCILMIGVGSIEEMVFRGFLFKAIETKSGIKRAIVISGITFGIGHIVNLFRGYGYEELIGQIIVAIAIGIVLALLVAITKNIVPGILFHIVFNISGAITKVGSYEIYLMIAILSIALCYAFYLSRFMESRNKAAEFKEKSMS
jgi:membrane protease YdiL (CAAX protease family)